jgi:hypothetical protein
VVAALGSSAAPASAGGINHLSGDGSLRFVSDSTQSIQTWRAIATRSGGEVMPLD